MSVPTTSELLAVDVESGVTVTLPMQRYLHLIWNDAELRRIQRRADGKIADVLEECLATRCSDLRKLLQTTAQTYRELSGEKK
jgi:hypothetical protein